MSSAPLDDSGDTLVDSPKSNPQAKLREEREEEYTAKIRERFKALVQENSSQPVIVSEIELWGPRTFKTSQTLIRQVLDPIRTQLRDPHGLEEALSIATATADKLQRFGIFKDPILVSVGRSNSANANVPIPKLDVYLKAVELGRTKLSAGTAVGNLDGNLNVHATFRNLYGGAEFLRVNGSIGKVAKNTLSASFDAPIRANPDFTYTLDAIKSANIKDWASHEEALVAFGARLRWTTPYLAAGITSPSRDPRLGDTHEIGYTGAWRQITGLATFASQPVRADAGDSIKSSITHTWKSDTRENPYIHSTGRLLKTTNELAGVGPLGGDVGFLKSEFEFSSGKAIRSPFAPTKASHLSGWSIMTGFRTGLLFPLPIGLGESSYPSRINDRFQLGGPTDVRGFRQGGIGPRDFNDALGGDMYAAGNISLLTPLPFVSPENPLRLQFFLNAGRLVALGDKEKRGAKEGWSSKDVASKVGEGVREVALGGYPSTAAGLGLVYAHPMARFELNFALPVVTRYGESVRKGFQLGVGIDFL